MDPTAPAPDPRHATTGVAPRRAAFVFIFATVVLDMLALGIMVPVLPKLVVEFEGGDMAKAAAISGYFGLAWAAMQFLFSPVIGVISDRFGRRPIVLLSNLGLGLDYVLMALAPSLAWLFVGRLMSGITSATFSAATAYITDVTPPEQRASRFGMLGAAFGIGFIVGPAIGGVLGSVDLRLPFWVAGALSLANACYGFFVLPESLPKERRTPFTWGRANPLGSLALLRSHVVLHGLAGAMFLYFVAHEILPSMFVLYADYRYGWDEKAVGLSLAVIGVCSALVSAVLVGRAVERFGERACVAAGLAFGAAGMALYGFAPTGAVFLAAIPLVALWGIGGPPMQSLMTRYVDPSRQGELQGALSSLRGVTGMIGPVLFTQTFAAGIRGETGIELPGAPFFLAALMLVASVAVALRYTRPGLARPVTVPNPDGAGAGAPRASGPPG